MEEDAGHQRVRDAGGLGPGEGRGAVLCEPGPAVDAYGAGDCFAAGFTYALADGRTSGDAVAFGARCGAACMAGRGPYEGQLRTPL